MKKWIFGLLVLLLAGTAQAEIELKDGSIAKKYFSEVELYHFLAEQLDNDRVTREKGESSTTVTIQINGGPVDEEGFTAEERSTAEDGGFSGYITCDVSQHYPHKTYYNNVLVVKAKSSGGCDFVHVAGPPPPTLTWDLYQILEGTHAAGAVHSRTGEHPRWNDSSAFIVTSCSNGTWTHGDYMFITAPPGYYFANGSSTIYWFMGTVSQAITC